MAIFIRSCSSGECQHRVDHRHMDVKIVHVLCDLDNEVCDFDYHHPDREGCRHLPYLSCKDCSREWRCNLT